MWQKACGERGPTCGCACVCRVCVPCVCVRVRLPLPLHCRRSVNARWVPRPLNTYVAPPAAGRRRSNSGGVADAQSLTTLSSRPRRDCLCARTRAMGWRRAHQSWAVCVDSLRSAAGAWRVRSSTTRRRRRRSTSARPRQRSMSTAQCRSGRTSTQHLRTHPVCGGRGLRAHGVARQSVPPLTAART